MSQVWHNSSPDARISLSQPLSYADRLRIRQPGDAAFALGPHIDGGGVERWEKHGYGIAHTYDELWKGNVAGYDPWDASKRVDVVSDNYEGLGACSMFRMWQGWLSMSHAGPGEGTLLVNPMLKMATTYMLLRPFFEPLSTERGPGFLDRENWVFTGPEKMTSALQGATPGHGQELSDELHPHLELEKTMVHMPQIKPGDFVAWHCDSKSLPRPFDPGLGRMRLDDKLTHCVSISHPRGRQNSQRQGRLERLVHPRVPRHGHQRAVPCPTEGGIPGWYTRSRLPRRAGRVAACR